MPRFYAEHARGYDLGHELPFVEIDGKRCLLGSAGSLILGCDRCGAEHFREWADPNDTCFICRGHVMRPMHLDDLATVWRPLWEATGGSHTTVEERKAQRLKLEAEFPRHWQFGDKTEADFPSGYVKSAKAA
jgi:hypothetical protein